MKKYTKNVYGSSCGGTLQVFCFILTNHNYGSKY